jgi:hypothetical protein
MIDTGVPVAIHGTVTYSVEDSVAFKNINPKEKYDDESFKLKLRSAVIKYVKGVVCTLPSDDHFPLVQLESKVVEISDAVYSMVAPQIEHSMGVKVVSFDITKIFIDKTSRGFRELKAITADFEKETLMAEQMAKLNELKLQQQMQYSQMEMQGKLNMDAMII